MDSSERVKIWRRKTKQKIIDCMGGKCQICGYNKCNSALSLHHIDPTKKEFSFGAIRACPASWDKIVEELRKCILLCHNCHSEIHENLTSIPDKFQTFQDVVTETKKEEKTYCPVCGDEKPTLYKTCSRKCAAKLANKFDWSSIDLLEEIKTKSVVKIAAEIGVSDAAVHKRLKRIKSFQGV